MLAGALSEGSGGLCVLPFRSEQPASYLSCSFSFKIPIREFPGRDQWLELSAFTERALVGKIPG